jgi:hypothetical protein
MRLHPFPGVLIGSVVILSFTGCEKKSGEAVVLEKEHIAAAEVPPPEPTGSPSKSMASDEAKVIEMGKNDIVVDQYVMDKDVRGTSRDPRALGDEQWLIKVRMIDGGRQFTVHADQAQFKKLTSGDRVKVSYRVGNYTGTVWDSEIR